MLCALVSNGLSAFGPLGGWNGCEEWTEGSGLGCNGLGAFIFSGAAPGPAGADGGGP